MSFIQIAMLVYASYLADLPKSKYSGDRTVKKSSVVSVPYPVFCYNYLQQSR